MAVDVAELCGDLLRAGDGVGVLLICPRIESIAVAVNYCCRDGKGAVRRWQVAIVMLEIVGDGPGFIYFESPPYHVPQQRRVV